MSCDGIGYTFAVPANCTPDTPCGVLWDIHGGLMSATAQNAHTGLRASGREAGHVVVQPTAPVRIAPLLFDRGPVWRPNEDYAKLEAVLRQLASTAEINASRVHVTGFSMGGFTTWSLLCRASDVICSVAPLASSGLDAWGSGRGFGQTCFGDASSASPGPTTARPILYGNGATDTTAAIAQAHMQKQYVLNAYGMVEGNVTSLQPQGAEYNWSQWTAEDVTFEYLEHNFNGNSYEGHLGHCIPRGQAYDCGMERTGSAGLYVEGTEDTYVLNEGCCASFVWSDVVLEFFARHPCKAGAGGDDSAIEVDAGAFDGVDAGVLSGAPPVRQVGAEQVTAALALFYAFML